jgi:putative endonuclease
MKYTWIQNGHLPRSERPWYVYLVHCADDSYYTGITQDLLRRVQQHNGELPGGAKYTASRRPVALVFSLQCSDKSHALTREHHMKRQSHAAKLKLASRR